MMHAQAPVINHEHFVLRFRNDVSLQPHLQAHSQLFNTALIGNGPGDEASLITFKLATTFIAANDYKYITRLPNLHTNSAVSR